MGPAASQTERRALHSLPGPPTPAWTASDRLPRRSCLVAHGCPAAAEDKEDAQQHAAMMSHAVEALEAKLQQSKQEKQVGSCGASRHVLAPRQPLPLGAACPHAGHACRRRRKGLSINAPVGLAARQVLEALNRQLGDQMDMAQALNEPGVSLRPELPPPLPHSRAVDPRPGRAAASCSSKGRSAGAVQWLRGTRRLLPLPSRSA